MPAPVALNRPSIPRRLAAALVAALAGALATHVGTLVLLVLGAGVGLAFLGQADASFIAQMHSQFIPSTLFLLVALFVFGFFGIYVRWYLSLAAGLVLGVGAVLGGTSLQLGSSLSSVPAATFFGTLVTYNLPFVVMAALATTFVARRVWAAIERGRRGAATSARVALVRVPAENLADGIVHGAPVEIDVEKANDQWDAYVSALLENGWSTVEVEPAPTLADSVFVEDAAVVFGPTAVITNPGAESRRGEVDDVEASLADAGLAIERIVEPGTLDGGDVLKVGRTVYVGRGGRTNAEGVRQLRAILAATDYTVVAVPVSKVLHLKSAVTALPDGTVLGHPSTVDDPAVFERYLEMPEPEGAHVVVLDADAVLMAASAPASAELVESLGYRVVRVDISEFEKLDGCVTCLSIRIR